MQRLLRRVRNSPGRCVASTAACAGICLFLLLAVSNNSSITSPLFGPASLPDTCSAETAQSVFSPGSADRQRQIRTGGAMTCVPPLAPWGGRYAPATRAALGLPPLDLGFSTSLERHRPQPQFPDNLHPRGALAQRARDYRSPWVRRADVVLDHARRHNLLADSKSGQPGSGGDSAPRLQVPPVSPSKQRRPTRVLMVSNEVMGVGYSGGVGTEILESSRALLESNWPFHVTILYTASCDGEVHGQSVRENIAGLVRELGPQRFAFVCLEDTEEWQHWKPRLIPAGAEFWALQQAQLVYLWMRANEQSVDVVHAADYGGLTGIAIQARRQGVAFANVRFITFTHGCLEWAMLASGKPPVEIPELVQSIPARWATEGADILQATNVHMGEATLRKGLEVKAPLLMAAPNVFSSVSEAQLRRARGAGPNQQPSAPGPVPVQEIVFFGRLENRKGWRLIVDAVLSLAKAYADKRRPVPAQIITVTFIGPKIGPEPDVIKSLWEQGDVGRFFRLKLETQMARDEYLAYLQQPGRLVVVPSLTENLPFTVIEALLSGAHLLAANVGGIPELLDHVDAQALVSSNVPGWTEALGRSIAQGLGRRPQLAFDMAQARLTAQVLHARAAELAAEQEADLAQRRRRGLPVGHARAAVVHQPGPDDLVTVCVASHNREALLDAALGSVAQQTFTAMEVIVFDDASDSAQRAQIGHHFAKWRASASGRRLRGWRLMDSPRGENVWLGAARKLCAAQASEHSRWLMFMDDDDMLETNYIETTLRAALSHPADLVSSHHGFFNDGGKVIRSVAEARAAIEATWLPMGTSALMLGLGDNYLGSSNILIRKSVYWQLGGHSEVRDVLGEDYGLWVRAATYGVEGVIVPHPLYLRRYGDFARMTMDVKEVVNSGPGSELETMIHSLAALTDSGALGPLSLVPLAMAKRYGRLRPSEEKAPVPEAPRPAECKNEARAEDAAVKEKKPAEDERALWGTFPGSDWSVGLALLQSAAVKAVDHELAAMADSRGAKVRRQLVRQVSQALRAGDAAAAGYAQMRRDEERKLWRRDGGSPWLSADTLRPFVGSDGRVHPAKASQPAGKDEETMAPFIMWSGPSEDKKTLSLGVDMRDSTCGDGVVVVVLVVTIRPGQGGGANHGGGDDGTVHVAAEIAVDPGQDLKTELGVGSGPVAILLDPRATDFCDNAKVVIGFKS